MRRQLTAVSVAARDAAPNRPAAKPSYPSAHALRILHWSAAATHVLWVALAASCFTSYDDKVVTPVWTQNITYAAGEDNSFIQFGPRTTVFKFYPLPTLIGFVAITAVAHVGYALLPGAGGDGNPWRWLEYMISATMLTLNASVGVGASSEDAFAFVLALSVVMQATGLGLDMVHDSPVARMRELLLFMGFTCCVVIVVVLARHAHSAVGILVNEQRVAATYGLFYLSFGVVGTLRAYNVGLLRGSAFTEFVYVMLSLSCKTSMFWLSYAGIRQTLEHVLPDQPRAGVDWALVQNLAASVPGSLAAAGIAAAVFWAPSLDA